MKVNWRVAPRALYWGPRFLHDRYGVPTRPSDLRTHNCIVCLTRPLPLLELQLLSTCKSKMLIELRCRSNHAIAFVAVTE